MQKGLSSRFPEEHSPRKKGNKPRNLWGGGRGGEREDFHLKKKERRDFPEWPSSSGGGEVVCIEWFQGNMCSVPTRKKPASEDRGKRKLVIRPYHTSEIEKRRGRPGYGRKGKNPNSGVGGASREMRTIEEVRIHAGVGKIQDGGRSFVGCESRGEGIYTRKRGREKFR